MLVHCRYNKVVEETGSKFTPQNSTIVQFETALTQSQGQPMKVDCLDTGSLLGSSLPRFCNQFNFQDNSFFLIHRYWKSFWLTKYFWNQTRCAWSWARHSWERGSSQINVKWILVVSLSVRKCTFWSHLGITLWKSNTSTGINASLSIGLCGEKYLYEKQTPSCCERVRSFLGDK